MNTLPVYLLLFSLAVCDVGAAAAPELPAIPGLDKPEEAAPYDEEKAIADMKARELLFRKQAPQWDRIIKEFYRLQGRRAAMLTAPDKAWKQHVEALRKLYDQVIALKETLKKVGGGEDDWEITISTELRIFGVGTPTDFYWVINDNQRVKPKTLVDPRTHVTYKLSSDGRHVTAISPNGKILWAHDAFRDYGLAPYRYTMPVIVVFHLSASSKEEYEAAQERLSHEANTFTEARDHGFEKREDYKKRFIEITFNSSQHGDIDAETGKFTFIGAN
jgi:hypothetical protein